MMENYLNIAEWGEGVFGAEAAARRYFGKSAPGPHPPRGGAARDRPAEPVPAQPGTPERPPPRPRGPAACARMDATAPLAGCLTAKGARGRASWG